MKIDVISFPDPKFEAVVRKAMNKPDGKITKADAEKVVSLEFGHLARVSDTTGLENFINLKVLNCSHNRGKLTELDVSANTKLTVLDCSHNQFTELDVRTNTKLAELYCNNNQLTKLDVSTNTELKMLDCSHNRSFELGLSLTGLDVRANTKLIEFKCLSSNFRNLTKLDISANAELTVLWCDGYQLIELDVSANTALTELCCNANVTGIVREVDIALLRLITGEERKRYVDSLIWV